jgi:hypothetical protein
VEDKTVVILRGRTTADGTKEWKIKKKTAYISAAFMNL